MRYHLNETTKVASLTWQFEWPLLLSAASAAAAATAASVQGEAGAAPRTTKSAKERVWDLVTEHDLYNEVGPPPAPGS